MGKKFVNKMEKNELYQKSLEYHNKVRAGKLEIIPSKSVADRNDLTLAYSPGVGAPCMEIQKNKENAYKYTSKSNLVAVITNGTAVLGFGDIGALAGKPVMEGKSILFKKFADIDSVDVEVDVKDPKEFIRTVQNIASTYGGINLEDIKAPECFEIERTLKETTDIPIFHDDQHGTAVITYAALLNALEIVNKTITDVKVVINGAGAAAIAMATLYKRGGFTNIIMCDSKGVIYKGRTEGMNPQKERHAVKTDARTLEEASAGADVLIGVSVKNAFSKQIIKSLGENPIVFALANPDPEILPPAVSKIRKDVIMATGRSDFPNQVNNVLCFPFLFRGALDARSTHMTTNMKIAAAKALSQLAKEPVPESVKQAYGNPNMCFSKDYIIPTPGDPRLISAISPAVAKQAMEDGVARKPIEDFDAYVTSLDKRLERLNKILGFTSTL